MESLTRYQIYFLARDGEVLRRLDLDCASDRDAVQKATHLRGADVVELEVWERTRLVRWLPVPAVHCSHYSRPSIAGSFDTIGGQCSDDILREEAVSGLSLFNFRSPERNRETDERRLAQIRRVVHSAVADAEAESKGLRARIAKARRSGIFLLVEVGGPDPTRCAELRTLEKDVVSAEGRLAQLRDHLVVLRGIEVATTRLPH
jgi:hypothetical protein